LYKNLPSRLLIPVFVVRFPLDAVAALKFLIDGGFKDFYAVLRAHFYFYFHYSELKKKRRKLKQSNTHGIYQKNLVREYYLNNKKLFSDLDPADFSK